MQYCFRLFTKIKRGVELAFGAHFLHVFFNTNAPYLILCQLTEFLPSQDIKQNVLLSSYLDN